MLLGWSLLHMLKVSSFPSIFPNLLEGFQGASSSISPQPDLSPKNLLALLDCQWAFFLSILHSHIQTHVLVVPQPPEGHWTMLCSPLLPSTGHIWWPGFALSSQGSMVWNGLLLKHVPGGQWAATLPKQLTTLEHEDTVNTGESTTLKALSTNYFSKKRYQPFMY